jgi:hypothetical protein
MALPSYSEIITDNVTEEVIDAYTLQKDLEHLRKLVLTYNSQYPLSSKQRIPLDDIKDNKLKLIIALWQMNIEIPEYLNLTWGAPYDELFISEVEEYRLANGEYRPVEAISIYILINNPILLAGFLMGSINIPAVYDRGIDYIHQRHQNLNMLNDTILTPLNLPPVKENESFGKLLLTLNPFALAYIALRIKDANLFVQGVRLDYFIWINRGN